MINLNTHFLTPKKKKKKHGSSSPGFLIDENVLEVFGIILSLLHKFYSELYPNDSMQRLLIYSSIPRVLPTYKLALKWNKFGTIMVLEMLSSLKTSR